MRPLYEQLKRQHYSSNHTRAGFASGEGFFRNWLRLFDDYQATTGIRKYLCGKNEPGIVKMQC
ncbi:hypothetical protein FJMB00501_24540 [Enterobacter hormaechei]|nr:hypothetical protein FJMB00501_24540 [Enterobacter hormaechei]